jgi:ABC-2 type transport system permease protein
MRRTLAVLRREWTELSQNRFLVISTLMLPLILSSMVIFAALSLARSDVHPSEVESLLAQAPRGYTPRQVVMFMLMKQLLATFLAVPAIIPALITSYSIIGEKQLRTLEPVLATPIRVGELLAGKCLAAFVPALVATWVSFGLTCAVLQARLPPESAQVAPPTADWLLAVFVVAPLLAFGSNTLTVIVSSRVRDPRAAHQFASLLLLPIIGVVLVQLARGILLGWRFWLGTALALLWLDVILLRLASRWFNREGILAKFG